ncbi:MAG TPA: hypothetical protein VJS42_04630 [Steroidobacteraceae bacterium]|nr:hypothetical protein [Steroidobacteraceae bacterium]
MIAPLSEIIAAIRVSLSERVLPQLQQASWIAADVRSSLALLTYVEDALSVGADALGRANVAMIELLEGLMELDEVSFITPELRSRIPPTIEATRNVPPSDLAALDVACNALKALISELISASSARRTDQNDVAAIQRLRSCLLVIAAEELRISRRAGEMPAF